MRGCQVLVWTMPLSMSRVVTSRPALAVVTESARSTVHYGLVRTCLPILVNVKLIHDLQHPLLNRAALSEPHDCKTAYRRSKDKCKYRRRLEINKEERSPPKSLPNREDCNKYNGVYQQFLHGRIPQPLALPRPFSRTTDDERTTTGFWWS